ncbi:MAG: hypothetical protein ACI9NG_002934, partial [Hyphomonas sp.]
MKMEGWMSHLLTRTAIATILMAGAAPIASAQV